MIGILRRGWLRKMAKRGLFINFEGIDGSGTSTQVHCLEERIENLDKYQDVLRTHEPWKNKDIKRKLKEDAEAYSGGLEMAELYVEDRTNHTRELIRPNLEAGVFVLNSRYKMSTCAYQWTQKVPIWKLLQMHENRGLITPDLTFFLDVTPEVAEERIRKRGTGQEKFEKSQSFREKLIKSYHALIKISEVEKDIFGKVVKIDATRKIQDVAEDIYKKFLEVYEEHVKSV